MPGNSPVSSPPPGRSALPDSASTDRPRRFLQLRDALSDQFEVVQQIRHRLGIGGDGQDGVAVGSRSYEVLQAIPVDRWPCAENRECACTTNAKPSTVSGDVAQHHGARRVSRSYGLPSRRYACRRRARPADCRQDDVVDGDAQCAPTRCRQPARQAASSSRCRPADRGVGVDPRSVSPPDVTELEPNRGGRTPVTTHSGYSAGVFEMAIVRSRRWAPDGCRAWCVSTAELSRRWTRCIQRAHCGVQSRERHLGGVRRWSPVSLRVSACQIFAQTARPQALEGACGLSRSELAHFCGGSFNIMLPTAVNESNVPIYSNT